MKHILLFITLFVLAMPFIVGKILGILLSDFSGYMLHKLIDIIPDG